MSMLGWFGLAFFALIASVALWWADYLQGENQRLRRKILRLLEEENERLRYEYVNTRITQDPATVLKFPNNRRRDA